MRWSGKTAYELAVEEGANQKRENNILALMENLNVTRSEAVKLLTRLSRSSSTFDRDFKKLSLE